MTEAEKERLLLLIQVCSETAATAAEALNGQDVKMTPPLASTLAVIELMAHAGDVNELDLFVLAAEDIRDFPTHMRHQPDFPRVVDIKL